MIIWTVNPNPIACAYPLDADAATVISYGFGGKLTMSGADQTGTYTANGTNRTFGAFPASTTPTVDILSAGTKVVEFVFTPTALTGGVGGVNQFAYISTGLGETIIGCRVRSESGGGFSVSIYRGATTVGSLGSVTPDSSGNVIIGIEANCTAGTFKAKCQGSYVSLSSDNFTPQLALLIFSTQEQAVAAGDVGNTYVTTVSTAAEDITQSYAVGATDVCGHSLA
ncbi:MAG: hypothetical protein ABFD96_12960 [Armatimonadia bacterium]